MNFHVLGPVRFVHEGLIADVALELPLIWVVIG